MRLASLDLGSASDRTRDRTRRGRITTSDSTRSLASMLRKWQDDGGGSDPPPGTVGCGARSAHRRTFSTRSLATKFSTALSSLKGRTGSVEISAPISATVMHPGLALTEFGTPIRTSGDGDWSDLVRVRHDDHSPSTESEQGSDPARRLFVDTPPVLPGIPKISPLLRSSTRRGSSSLGPPAACTPSGPRSMLLPQMPARMQVRHQSLPPATLLPPDNNADRTLTRPEAVGKEPDSPLVTPTCPPNGLKREALHERASQLAAIQDIDPSATTPPSPHTTLSECSNGVPSQFKIRRKPVPKLDIDTSVELSTGTLSSGSATSVSDSSWSVASGSIPRMSSDRSWSFASASRPLSDSSTFSDGLEEAVTSTAISVKLPTNSAHIVPFGAEFDTLFDELLDQVCVDRIDSAPHTPTPVHYHYHRSKSLQLMSLEENNAESLVPRGRVLHHPPTEYPTTISLPGFKQLAAVDEHEHDGANSGDAFTAQHKIVRTRSDPVTPRPKHRRVSNLPPFFPSGHSFEPIRAGNTPARARSFKVSTSVPSPATARVSHMEEEVGVRAMIRDTDLL